MTKNGSIVNIFVQSFLNLYSPVSPKKTKSIVWSKNTKSPGTVIYSLEKLKKLGQNS